MSVTHVRVVCPECGDEWEAFPDENTDFLANCGDCGTRYKFEDGGCLVIYDEKDGLLVCSVCVALGSGMCRFDDSSPDAHFHCRASAR